MSFEVPGFNLPSEPVAAASKKRKRPSKVAEDASAALPAVNVEKLLNKYESLLKAQSPASKPHAAAVGKSDTKLSKKQKKANNKQASEPAPVDTQEASSSKVSQEPTNEKRAQKKQKKQAQPDDGLSELQQKMKGKLGGARFRWINEQLYTTGGAEAAKMMEDDPSVFSEYHTGFQSQAAAWPSNPLDLLIASISTLPTSSLVVDLGCGEGRLAQELTLKSYKVISYDLVSPNAFVQVAQCTSHIPLPGDAEGQSSIADVVVCCLSLMGKDWYGMISEAQRILRKGGKLKIAEVSSRFTDVSAFEAAVGQAGFKLLSKDDSNSHFVLFEFQKKGLPSKKGVSEFEHLLKPCIYKKR